MSALMAACRERTSLRTSFKVTFCADNTVIRLAPCDPANSACVQADLFAALRRPKDADRTVRHLVQRWAPKSPRPQCRETFEPLASKTEGSRDRIDLEISLRREIAPILSFLLRTGNS